MYILRNVRHLLWALLLVQLFHLSIQNRRPHWPKSIVANSNKQWRTLPNSLLAAGGHLRLDAESDDCTIDNKCISGGSFQRQGISTGEIVGLNDIFDEIEVKRFPSKKYPGDEGIVVPMSSSFDDAKAIFFKSSHLATCSCDVRYELIDLHANGHVYYPRYVPSAICSAEVCWNTLYKCQPKYYEMYFLKRRDSGDDLADGVVATSSSHNAQPQIGPLLPESLRKEWVYEPMSVAVSCECLPA